jgi:pimeloyl-ACP methyl ester carboxylesterase
MQEPHREPLETQCRREVSELMAANLEVVGSEDGLAVLYFHGAASVRDFGPSDELRKRSGIRLFRFCRPGYDNSAARPSASLIDVAEDALSILVSMGIESVVVLGWSGGGPYALASMFAKTRIVSKVGLIASWAPMSPPDPGLPDGVRFFMKAAQVLPRPLLRVALAATGRRTAGHADDIRRVARPWGFALSELPSLPPVAVWHATNDPNVPIKPWQNQATVALHEHDGQWHEPSETVWVEVFDWAKSRSASAPSSLKRT